MLEIAEDLLLGKKLFFGLLVLPGGLLFGFLDLFLGLLLAIFVLLGGFGSLVGVLLGLLNECLLRLVLLGGTLELERYRTHDGGPELQSVADIHIVFVIPAHKNLGDGF